MKDFQFEVATAVRAVRRAARLCRSVQLNMSAGALEKKDKSPVTIADFGSQAIICHCLGEAFPDDPIVGEEDSTELRESGNEAFLQRIVSQLSATGCTMTPEEACDWVDRGGCSGADSSGGRFWTLDPIDGTKGFLRGQQYAVSLALIEDGRIVVGVVGCPNQPLESTPRQAREQADVIDSGGGSLFVATHGGGSQVLPVEGEGQVDGTPVCVSDVTEFSLARLCESVESGHSSHNHSAQIAADLGIVQEPARLDSQAKYAVVARGEADIYLRLPTRPGYREKIWDHAGGVLVIEEAGGVVTDVIGRPLNFTLGRELTENRGVIVTNGQLHQRVLAAVKKTGVV